MASTNKKFYSNVQIKSDIIIDNATANRVSIFDADKKVKPSTVTSTELESLSGIDSNIQDQIDAEESARIAADGVLQGEIDALEAEIAALPDPIVYKGLWNATTNTPTLANSDTGKTGWLYYVSVAGSVDFGAGSISFEVGDKVVNNGTTWDKWDMTDAVSSVFGRSGAVVAQSGDYTAAQVSSDAIGDITATNVQDALAEIDTLIDNVQTDIDNHIAELTGAHAASAIAVTPAGNLSATDVQAALEELQTELDNFAPGSAGDIQETSFSFANNQSSATNVTGLSFANGVVRSFQAIVSVYIDASSDLFEQFELNGIQRGADWAMSIESEGDDSGLVFTITNTGQVQYTSENVAGFSAGTMKFRAITTSV